MKQAPDYTAAKAGDTRAAGRLVEQLVKPDKARSLQERFPGAIIVGVHAEEATGRNKIPAALADHLAHLTGLDSDDGIVQTNRVFHTGAAASARLGRVPEFAGPVQAGRDYIVVDDVTTSGSSLAALRAHIEANGGRVVAASVLGTTSNPQTGYGGYLAIKPETRQILESRFDTAALEAMLDEHGIAASIGALTNSQGRYLASFGTLDAIRNSLTATGQAGHHAGAARLQGGTGRGEAAGQRGALLSAAARRTLGRPTTKEEENLRRFTGNDEEDIRKAVAEGDPLLPYRVLNYWQTIGFTEIANNDNPDITALFEDAVARIPQTPLPGITVHRRQGYETRAAMDKYLRRYAPGAVITVDRPVNAFTKNEDYVYGHSRRSHRARARGWHRATTPYNRQTFRPAADRIEDASLLQGLHLIRPIAPLLHHKLF